MLKKARVKIADLKEKRDFPFAPLEAVGPNLSGWGVVETSLLLPHSICLMVGPLACLRHSAFMAHARSFFERFYMLSLKEVDIVMGNHIPKIREAMFEIARKERPQVLLLAGTCCDHILGTDYKEVIKEIKEAFGIEVIYLVMAPLTIGLKPSPFEIAYTALYEFLKDKRRGKDKGTINILGSFLPLKAEGELYTLLKEAGYERIYQIPTCNEIEELIEMASACLNIVIHPLGKILAEKMKNGMGIPYIFMPTSYGIKEIQRQYQKLEGQLGTGLRQSSYRQQAEKKLAQATFLVENKRVAVGCSVNGSPFELACALVNYGAKVKAIFARNVPKPHEWEYINWLRENSPDTYVYNVSHPYLAEDLSPFDEIEIVFGVDAGVYCRQAVNVPLSRYQVQEYGYENVLRLFEDIEKNVAHPIDNYDWIYKHNLLI